MYSNKHFLSLLVGYVVFLLLQTFSINISYIEALSLYIFILISIITMFNYIGAFEIAFAFSGSYYGLLPAQILIVGFTLRIVNMISQIIILIFLYLFRLINSLL